MFNLPEWIPSDNYPGWEFKIRPTTNPTQGILEGRNVEKGLSASTIHPLTGKASEDMLTFLEQESYLVGIAEADPELWLIKN